MISTLRQLDKYADKWFNNEMRRRGFAIEPKLVYWRKRGPLYYMFISHFRKGSPPDIDPGITIYATVWSPWADHPNGELGEFPPTSYLIGSDIYDGFPRNMPNYEDFEVGNETQIEANFHRILSIVDQVLPWFDSINSYETYNEYIGAHGFHPVPEYQEELRVGIARGFEFEPYF
jgi:hypothetical protein